MVEIAAAGPRHLLATHIRRNGRLTQDAEVDHQGGQPLLLDEIGNEVAVPQLPDHRVGNDADPAIGQHVQEHRSIDADRIGGDIRCLLHECHRLALLGQPQGNVAAGMTPADHRNVLARLGGVRIEIAARVRRCPADTRDLGDEVGRADRHDRRVGILLSEQLRGHRGSEFDLDC